MSTTNNDRTMVPNMTAKTTGIWAMVTLDVHNDGQIYTSATQNNAKTVTISI